MVILKALHSIPKLITMTWRTGFEEGVVTITYDQQTGKVEVEIELFENYLVETNIYFDDEEQPWSSSPGDYGFTDQYPEAPYTFRKR
jgi:hypothetical protein